MFKVYSKCGIEEDTSEFSKQKTVKSGVRAQCRECDKKCWHYSNLQPMWYLDNCKKSNKIME